MPGESYARHRLATETTLQATNTALGLLGKDASLQEIKTALGLLAKDGTLDDIKTALGLLAKDVTLTATNTALGLLAKDTTLQASNTALGLLAKDATLLAMANALVDVLASVKSINGKYGVVIMDSGDILISKNTVGSKTVKAVLTELEEAVAETPLSFTATAIPDTEDDYMITVTQGTPT